MRRRKYDAGGIFHFHAIDIWPSVTMACIDFYRVPHKVYYTVQRSFQPVLASLEYDRDRWQPGEEVRGGSLGDQRPLDGPPGREGPLAHSGGRRKDRGARGVPGLNRSGFNSQAWGCGVESNPRGRLPVGCRSY
jgi:hypothetical protein